MEAYFITVTPTFGRDILLQYILFSKCREDLLTEENRLSMPVGNGKFPISTTKQTNIHIYSLQCSLWGSKEMACYFFSQI